MRIGYDYIGVFVVHICHDGAGKILLHRRGPRARDEHGKWDWGGGGLEFGEDARAGVLRELKEEYGIEGEVQEQLPIYTMIREMEGRKTHWIGIPFILKTSDKSIKPEEGCVEEAGWFSFGDLPAPLMPGVKLILERDGDRLREILK